jgi:hypothetical protein
VLVNHPVNFRSRVLLLSAGVHTRMDQAQARRSKAPSATHFTKVLLSPICTDPQALSDTAVELELVIEVASEGQVGFSESCPPARGL